MWFAGPVTLLLVSYTASSNGRGYHYPSAKRPRRRISTALLSSRQMTWTAWGLHAEAKKLRLAINSWDFRNACRGGLLTEVAVQRDYARYENTPRCQERFREPPVAVFYN